MNNDFNSLRKALPYIRAFKNRTFVIKLGGELCENPQILDNIFEQLQLLHNVGIRLVVVHGGGKHATDLGQKLGVKSELIDGKRVTSAEMIEVVKMSFAGSLNTDVVAVGKKFDLPLVGLSGVDGGLVTAERRVPQKVSDKNSDRTVDFGYVGEIISVKPEILNHLLHGEYIPVICSLIADKDGQILNINADRLASRIASALAAEKLVFLGTLDGVLLDIHDHSSLISLLSVKEAMELLENGTATEGMKPKLTEANYAVTNGVHAAHVVSGSRPDAILEEIFTNQGSGTMITR